MGGKWDKRSNKSDILPELNHGNYFDKVVNYGADILRPYKDLVILQSKLCGLPVKKQNPYDGTALGVAKLLSKM